MLREAFREHLTEEPEERPLKNEDTDRALHGYGGQESDSNETWHSDSTVQESLRQHCDEDPQLIVSLGMADQVSNCAALVPELSVYFTEQHSRMIMAVILKLSIAHSTPRTWHIGSDSAHVRQFASHLVSSICATRPRTNTLLQTASVACQACFGAFRPRWGFGTWTQPAMPRPQRHSGFSGPSARGGGLSLQAVATTLGDALHCEDSPSPDKSFGPSTRGGDLLLTGRHSKSFTAA